MRNLFIDRWPVRMRAALIKYRYWRRSGFSRRRALHLTRITL